jgi:flagellar motility protein MotE (MotC chaperone)
MRYETERYLKNSKTNVAMNTRAISTKQKSSSRTTPLQSASRKRKTPIKSLILRLVVFITVAAGLILSTAFIDEETFSKYFMTNSYAKAATQAPVVDKKHITEAEKEIISNLKEKKEELERRETQITEQEKRIEEEKKNIEGKLAEIQKIRDEVSKKYDERLAVEKERLDKMVATFSSMKPAIAASVFETMELDLVVKLIDNMKGAKVAAILDKMSKTRATQITTAFALLKDKGQVAQNTNSAPADKAQQ